MAALAAAAAVCGCGFGPGEASEGEATLTVTRDYGSQRLLEATTEDPPATETVIRFLDREAEIETRYGGGFVQSIEGVSGGIREGRSLDWFFFVNGVESPVGAADAEVRGGDGVWWDYRDWTDAMRTPAVVGSWPEPFAQASAEDARLAVRVECAGSPPPCEDVSARLSEAGVTARVETLTRRAAADSDGKVLRILVGPWHRIDQDPAAAVLDAGPARSGVFARFQGGLGGETALSLLDETGAQTGHVGPGAGLVAALRDGDEPPTWLVTGTDRVGVAEAVGLLDEDHLADRYALAVEDGVQWPLPVIEGPP